MSQVQPQFILQELQDTGHQLQTEDKATHSARFYEALHSECEIESDPAPRPPELRVYRRTGTNVYQLNDLQNIWHKAPPSHAAPEPRPPRPRSPRRAKHRNQYRTGRAIATLFAVLGWLMVAGALGATVASVMQPALAIQYGLPTLLIGAGGAMFLGLLTVVMALAARAQFDRTNAALETVAIQRAQFGVEYP